MYSNMQSSAAAPAPRPAARGAAKDVPVLTVREFERQVALDQQFIQRQPVIVEGFIDQWPARRDWLNFDLLRARFGDVPVRASAPQFPTYNGQRICSVRTTFGDYLRYLEQPELAETLFEGNWMAGSAEDLKAIGSPLYCGTLRFVSDIHQAKMPELQPLLPRGVECWNDLIPHFYKLENHFWLFIARAGALTPLHTDNNAVVAYLAQFQGEKDITAFSPEDHEYIHQPGHGYLDLDNPDCERFPEWERARPWKARLTEGQLLFIGTRWAHHARTLKDSVTFSFEFVNSTNIDAFVDCREWLSDLGRFAMRQANSKTELPAADEWKVGRQLMLKMLRKRVETEAGSEAHPVLRRLLDRVEAQ